MKAVLSTGKEDAALAFENLESVKDEVSCYVAIQSKGFSARRPFYFSPLSRVLSELESLNSSLTGKVTFSEDYEDNAISFECDKFGHVIVEGELYLHSEHYHALRFSFETDQTCLAPFIRDLKKVAAANSDAYPE